MAPLLYRICTQLKFQGPCAIAVTATLAIATPHSQFSGVDLASLDRSTFMTYLSAVASILALFCSLSIAWVLFISQQNKSERVATYDLLKARLSQTQQWLLEQPISEDRELCLSLVYKLNTHDMSDLPQNDLGDEYRAYLTALDEAFSGEDFNRQRFYSISVGHFAYIEQLLSRIDLVSIRQIITKVFLDTLAKGIALVVLALLVLIAASMWYSEAVKPWLVLSAAFIAVGAALLLIEIAVDIRRHYNEELDFIETANESSDEA